MAACGVVGHLRWDAQEHPLGFIQFEPRLSWIVSSPDRGQRQTAYQVLVASVPAGLRPGYADIWDSGTYHCTQTMTNTQSQIIDSTCSSGSSLCVGPGRTFVSVIGMGGTGLRDQIRCVPTSATAPYPSLNTVDPSCPIWAAIYTTAQGAKFGALFISFNVDGNPKKAHAYFKNISGQTIDTYDIFAD